MLDKLAGGDADDALEETGEMVRVVKAEHARHLADVVALHQQTLADVDHIGVDVADGGSASCLAEKIAEIMGRIRHL